MESPTTDDVKQAAIVAPPGSVIILRGTWEAEEQLNFMDQVKLCIPNSGEQLFVFLTDDRTAEVLDEDAMAAAGWFRADAAGDVDDVPPVPPDSPDYGRRHERKP